MQQSKKHISRSKERKSLHQFIQLVMAFYACLILLSVYHHIKLYLNGVIDTLINSSFFILLIHHIGYTSLVALVLAFVFNFLENRRPGLGFRVTKYSFLVLFVIEGLLVDYFVNNFEILGAGGWDRFNVAVSPFRFVFLLVVFVMIGVQAMKYLLRFAAPSYSFINRMYPLTFIIFTFFLATLISTKRPVNENKTQYLAYSMIEDLLTTKEYSGDKKYPLLTENVINNDLNSFLNKTGSKPDVVLIVVEGLSASFVGPGAPYARFMPHLNGILENSLYWENFLSNSSERAQALPSLLGSLPYGESGFTNTTNSPSRNSLLGILKDNGYRTEFYFGGNSSLDRLDKFTFEERIDLLVDNKAFGRGFLMQDSDNAGLSLGYPDKELVRKWRSDHLDRKEPVFTIFQTLSTREPFLIPGRKSYKEKVSEILDAGGVPDRYMKIANKNENALASFIYTDEALKDLLDKYSKLPQYERTLFLITGTHPIEGFPVRNTLERYSVPFLIYGPMVKSPMKFEEIASHADLAPSLLGLLHTAYGLRVPAKASWLGNGLLTSQDKSILLHRHGNAMNDFIQGSVLLSGRQIYRIGSSKQLKELDDKPLYSQMRDSLKYWRAVNRYVVEENMLLPPEFSLYEHKQGLSKQELVWVNSVFSGTDYDKAYRTARKLAIDGQRERALLLCDYILYQVPGHLDTEILSGRIHAWGKDYNAAERILKECIRKNPIYDDSYMALLDVYYWSGHYDKVYEVKRMLDQSRVSSKEIREKIERLEGLLEEERNTLKNSEKIDRSYRRKIAELEFTDQ